MDRSATGYVRHTPVQHAISPRTAINSRSAKLAVLQTEGRKEPRIVDVGKRGSETEWLRLSCRDQVGGTLFVRIC